MIPISYWKSVEGQYSDNSWDKPLYTNEPNTAPTDCDYFTVRKTYENDSKSYEVSEAEATAIRDYLQFKGDVRDSQSGNSWRVYKNRISNTFDLSAIPTKA